MANSGDDTRGWGPPFAAGEAAYFLGVNRNKRSLTLNIGIAPGQKVLAGLIEKADVLIDNFKLGTLEKWGLGYEVLSAVNPRLIMVRISGYGQTGPYKDRPGFGRIGNAFGGLSFLAGYPDRVNVIASDVARRL